MIGIVEARGAWNFTAHNVNDYYAEICMALMVAGTETSPRGKLTRELHPTTVLLHEPRERIVTSYGRTLNLPFALAEAIQIITGQNDAQALAFYNSKIIEIQGEAPGVTRFNAAYGERLRKFETATGTVDQLEHVIQTLKHDPDSRQASVVLSHPLHDNWEMVTRDRACNVYAHAMIRDGKLDWMQVIRSNDAVWGIPYNLVQWSHVQEWVAASLGVQMGHLFIVQDSFHVYEDKYDDIEEVRQFDLYQFLDKPLSPMIASETVSDALMKAEREIRMGANYDDFKSLERVMGPYWCDVIATLYAYRLFKQKHDLMALTSLPENPELRLPMVRNFCQWRWNKDERYEDLQMSATIMVQSEGVPLDEARTWLTG